jgi:quinol monooxygenase YgiN
MAKVVKLRARSGRTADLDAALATAAAAADAEPGTRVWEFFAGADPESRVIIEVFSGPPAAAEHDRSAAVAALLASFADVLDGPADVDLYTTPDPANESRRI